MRAQIKGLSNGFVIKAVTCTVQHLMVIKKNCTDGTKKLTITCPIVFPAISNYSNTQE